MTFNIKISYKFSAKADRDKFNNATIRSGQYGATAAIKHLAAPSLYQKALFNRSCRKILNDLMLRNYICWVSQKPFWQASCLGFPTLCQDRIYLFLYKCLSRGFCLTCSQVISLGFIRKREDPVNDCEIECFCCCRCFYFCFCFCCLE